MPEIELKRHVQSVELKEDISVFLFYKLTMATTKSINDSTTFRGQLIFQSGISDQPVIQTNEEVVAKDATTIASSETVQEQPVTDSVTIAKLSLDNIFNRDYYFPTTVQWTVSQNRFQLLTDFALPRSFMDLDKIAPYGALNFHALYKSNFKMTMRTDATNYNQGILVMFAVPGVPTNYDNFSNLNYATVMNFPHVFLNVGLENTAELEVPFGSIYNMIPPNKRNEFTSSTVYVMVWSPLKAGTTAPSTLTVSFFIRPLDTFVGVKTTYLIAQSETYTKVQSVVKPIAHAILDNFPIPFSGAIKTIGSIFGMYDRVLINDVSNESGRSGDEPIRGVNTKICTVEVIPAMDNRYKQEPIMDLMHFAKIPSLAAVIPWTTSNSPGNILSTFTVSPTTPMMLQGLDSTGTINTWYATNISGIASLFKLYRGSIEMEIVIVSTSFHRGNLYVAFDPYGESHGDVQSIYGLPGVTLAVGSDTNSMRLRLPYSKHKDYIRVDYPVPDISEQLGKVYVVVQTALTAPVNTSTDVEILIYINAGDDAEFKYPQPMRESKVLREQRLIYQSKEITQFYEQDLLSPGFIIGDHSNIYNLMRRPDYVKTNRNTLGTSSAYVRLGGNRLPTAGIHTIISQLFKYNSGGVMVHLVSSMNKSVGCNAIFEYFQDGAIQPFGDSEIQAGPGNADGVWEGAIFNLTEKPTVNFLMPGYNDKPFFYNVPNGVGDEFNKDQTWYLKVNAYGLNTLLPIMETFVAHSAADDFRMYMPLSMFKLGEKIETESLGGYIPIMTSATVQGFTVAGNNWNNILAPCDRNLVTYGSPISGGSTSSYNITLPSQNSKTFSRLFIYLTYKDASSDVTIIGRLLGVEHVLLNRTNVAYASGFHDVEYGLFLDSITIEFTGGSASSGVELHEFQIYANTYGTLVPVMTSDTVPAGFIASASSVTSGFEAYRAFDNNYSTQWATTGAPPTAWVQMEFLNEQTLNSIDVIGRPSSTILSWNISASNDGVLFTVLYSSNENLTQILKSYDIRNATSYRYYRFNILTYTPSGYDPGLSTLQLFGAPIIAQSKIYEYSDSYVDSTSSIMSCDGNVADLADFSDSEQGLDEVADDDDPDPTDELVKLINDNDMQRRLDEGKLVFQAGGFFSDIYANIVDTFQGFINGVQAIWQAHSLVDTASEYAQKTVKMIKKIFNIIESICSIICGLYTVLTSDKEMIIGTGIVTVTSGVMRLASSAKLKEELRPQSSIMQDTYEKLKKKSREVADTFKKMFTTRYLLDVFQGLFSRMGFDVQIVSEIYERESAMDPEQNCISLAILTAVQFFLYGKSYQKYADKDFGLKVAQLQSEIEDIYNKYKLGDKINWRDKEYDADEFVVVFLKEMQLHRVGASYVHSRKEYGVRDVERTYNKLKDKMSKLKNLVSHAEPVSAYFFGDSGAGKSFLTTKCIPLILNAKLKDNKHNHKYIDFTDKPFNTYQSLLVHTLISSEDQRFDSLYAHQLVLVMDDAFTERSAADSALLTRIVNCANFEVPKANLEEKGEVYDSPFVFINSNESDPVRLASSFINSAEKLTRRLGKMYCVSRKSGLPLDIGEDYIQDIDEFVDKLDRYYCITEFTYNNNREIRKGNVITLARIIQDLIGRYNVNHQFNTEALDKVASLVTQIKTNSDESDSDDDVSEKQVICKPVLREIEDTKKIQEYYDQYQDQRIDWNRIASPTFFRDIKSDDDDDYIDAVCDARELKSQVKTREELRIEMDEALRLADRHWQRENQARITKFEKVDDEVNVPLVVPKVVDRIVRYTKDEIIDELEYAEESSDGIELNKTYLDDAKYYLLDDKAFAKQILTNSAIPQFYKEYLKLIKLTYWEGFVRFLARNKKNIVAAGVVGAVSVGGIALLVTVVKRLTSSIQGIFQTLVYDSMPAKPTITHLPSSRVIPQTQAALSVEDENIVTRIRKNVVSISWMKEGKPIEEMNGLFLNANTILVNKHFFLKEKQWKDQGYEIYLSQPCCGVGNFKKEVVAIPPDQRVVLKDGVDVVCCKLAVNWPNIRNIAKHISNKDVSSKYALLIGSRPEADLSVTWTGELSTQLMGAEKCEISWINFYNNVITEAGDCGRPYYVPGVGICGIHTAITPDMSYGAASVVKPVSVSDTPCREFVLESQATVNKFWHSTVLLNEQSKVDGLSLSCVVPRNTKFVRIAPTEENGDGGCKYVMDEECDYGPSIKKAVAVGDTIIDPYIENSQKWETEKRAGVPLRYLYIAAKYYARKMNTMCGAVFDEDEMINGVPGLEPCLDEFDMINGSEDIQMLSIALKTSSGIWGRWFTKGKTEFFDALPQKQSLIGTERLKYVFSDKARNYIIPELGKSFVSVLYDKEEQLKKGQMPSFPFICTFKDELRPNDKIKNGKTRIFEQSSLDFVLLCRKYFGSFVSKYRLNNGFDLYHGIGGDPDVKWKHYATVLKGNSPFGHAFDYKNFDGSLPKECYTFFKMVTDSYYGNDQESKLVRHGLIDSMQNGVHIMGRYVFESSQGNKSGNAFTDVFNSVSNVFLIYESFMAWQVSVMKKSADLSEFDRNVKMLTYGDDVVMSIKYPLIQKGYTGKFIQVVMAELGITITSALKSAEIEDCLPFSELTFLKRPFVYDEEFGIWKAPLPLKDILKEIKYRPKTSLNIEGDIGQRLVNVQRFLAHHNRETYCDVVERLRARDTNKLNLDYLTSSYDALCMEIKLKQS